MMYTLLVAAVMCQSPTAADCAAVVTVMNVERARHGLAPLRPNVSLGRAAQWAASDNARRGRLSHRGGDGSQCWGRAARFGYSGKSVGENCAWNYPTASAVVSGWMRSPGHRRAVLGRSYTDVGVAVEQGRNGPYCFAVFGGP